MPRYARELNDKQIYHVMLRGNNREKIFEDADNKLRFLHTLEEKMKEDAFYLYAYCIMDNHVHLVVRLGKDSLERVMKRIGTSYARYFNEKYKRIGHVFQDRYKSENVKDEQYLFAVIRYVHQNPVKAGISTIEGYRWSSYGEYLKQRKALTEVDNVLSMFSTNPQRAIKEFVRFSSEDSEDYFLDIREEKEIGEINVQAFIFDYLMARNLKTKDLHDACNKQVREELIRLLAKQSNLSLRGLADELGLNRELVRRVVSREPSRAPRCALSEANVNVAR